MEELLDVRLCDLDLRLEETVLQRRVDRLLAELERARLRFRPYMWLSTEWFTPEGSSGFAIPFYLAHPRLIRVEHSQMFEAEGGTQDSFMRLLRHETGHALDNAYRLHRKRSWRRAFGNYTQPYRAEYLARPSSRNYVQNLGFWYAQSHPAEDYAETFAVWLAPGTRWRKSYEGWPALAKLQQLDAMLKEIAGKKPFATTRDRPMSMPRLKQTLRDYYRRKKSVYAVDQPTIQDRQLVHLFGEPTGRHRRERASTFLRRNRVELRNRVAALTGQSRYAIDQSLSTMILRCRELGLRCVRPRSETRILAAVLLTMTTLNLTRSRSNRYLR
ncbi:MAG: putative zinc-binding metallopeptidase [Planctomycetota bacterium]